MDGVTVPVGITCVHKTISPLRLAEMEELWGYGSGKERRDYKTNHVYWFVFERKLFSTFVFFSLVEEARVVLPKESEERVCV